MPDWKSISKQLAGVTGVSAQAVPQGSVGGGSINQAMRLVYGDVVYFVKLNVAERVDMFAAEHHGLQVLAESHTVRVPRPLVWGEDGETSWLVMEHLELGGSSNSQTLGEQMAAMHRVTQAQFGWEMDNTIGSTPQCNALTDNWIDFWREHRLQYQLDLAASHGHGGSLQSDGERLLELFPALFESYAPEASLLHGDLWSGNHAYSRTGEPVIFDPAVYFGDRETDLAMTELFGGFGAGFYDAYRDHYPLDSGYKARKTLYNLYHILNHLNLFGGGYLAQAQGMIDALISELR